MEFVEHLPSHNGGLCMPWSTMNDSVPDAQETRAAVPRAEQACQCIQCLPAVTNRAIQHLIGDLCALGILHGEARFRANSLDLSPRLEPPVLDLRPLINAELQTR